MEPSASRPQGESHSAPTFSYSLTPPHLPNPQPTRRFRRVNMGGVGGGERRRTAAVTAAYIDVLSTQKAGSKRSVTELRSPHT